MARKRKGNPVHGWVILDKPKGLTSTQAVAKVRRLLARGKSEKEAEQLVDSVDRERADFIRKYFGVEWPDRAVYHSMINTTIGDDAVVHTILDFMKSVDARAADRAVRN